MTNEAFAPFQRLAADLLKHLPADHPDGSHDLSHIHRVWVNAQRIQHVEGGDLEVLLAAALLHDRSRKELALARAGINAVGTEGDVNPG
jgi:uncharacterized protein